MEEEQLKQEALTEEENVVVDEWYCDTLKFRLPVVSSRLASFVPVFLRDALKASDIVAFDGVPTRPPSVQTWDMDTWLYWRLLESSVKDVPWQSVPCWAGVRCKLCNEYNGVSSIFWFTAIRGDSASSSSSSHSYEYSYSFRNALMQFMLHYNECNFRRERSRLCDFSHQYSPMFLDFVEHWQQSIPNSPLGKAMIQHLRCSMDKVQQEQFQKAHAAFDKARMEKICQVVRQQRQSRWEQDKKQLERNNQKRPTMTNEQFPPQALKPLPAYCVDEKTLGIGTGCEEDLTERRQLIDRVVADAKRSGIEVGRKHLDRLRRRGKKVDPDEYFLVCGLEYDEEVDPSFCGNTDGGNREVVAEQNNDAVSPQHGNDASIDVPPFQQAEATAEVEVNRSPSNHSGTMRDPLHPKQKVPASRASCTNRQAEVVTPTPGAQEVLRARKKQRLDSEGHCSVQATGPTGECQATSNRVSPFGTQETGVDKTGATISPNKDKVDPKDSETLQRHSPGIVPDLNVPALKETTTSQNNSTRTPTEPARHHADQSMRQEPVNLPQTLSEESRCNSTLVDPKRIVWGNDQYKDSPGNKWYHSLILEVRQEHRQLSPKHQDLSLDELVAYIVSESEMKMVRWRESADGDQEGAPFVPLAREEQRQVVRHSLSQRFPDFLVKPFHTDALMNAP